MDLLSKSRSLHAGASDDLRTMPVLKRLLKSPALAAPAMFHYTIVQRRAKPITQVSYRLCVNVNPPDPDIR